MKNNLLLVLCLLTFSLQAQYRIKILNPSFEADNARIGVITQGWFNCGKGKISPPDLHSKETSFFNVREKAAHGENYISLIAKSNKTWEAIGQRLPKPLDKFRIHHIAFRAKLSKSLRVYNRSSHNLERYNNAVSVQMWAGNSPGSKQEFLGATEPLNFTSWTKVHLLFRPSKRYRYICFDVTYASEDGLPYNGNVLLDRFSPISIVPDTLRYRPVCVNDEVLKVIDEKLIKSKDLERLAHQYVQANMDLGNAVADLPQHLTTIAKVVTFRKRMKKGGARNFFYTEKIDRLKEVIVAFYTLDATEEAAIMEKYLLDENNYQNDHLKRKAARKLAKQFTKNEEMNEFLLRYITANRDAILSEFTHCNMTKSIRL